MREDIVALLGMEDPEEVVTGFDRPNLSYAVRKTILPAGAARVPLVLELLKGAEMPAVVYAHTKRHTEELASGLTGSGIEARPYHAGIPAAERNAVQDAFMGGRLPVICATVAFGMGVDKPDIRTVIHAGVPSSIPAYAQEAGRAGRDGDPASCVVLFSEKELEARREVASLGRADASDARAFLEALFARAEPTPDGVAAGEKAGGKSGGLLRANVPVGELFALGDIGPEKAQDVARALEGIGKIRRRYNLWSGVRVRCVSPDASRARALGRAASAVHEVLLARAPAQAGAGVLPLPDVARESGLSPASVQVALSRLRGAGLVEISPAGGTVADILVKPDPLSAEERRLLSVTLDFRGRAARAHLDAIGRYASLTTCRREHLLGHFGDSAANGVAPCGGCDVCDPGRGHRGRPSLASRLLTALASFLSEDRPNPPHTR